MLPVSLDCPFLIVPSVFSIVYFLTAYFYSCSLNKLLVIKNLYIDIEKYDLIKIIVCT